MEDNVEGHTHGLLTRQGIMDPENTLPSPLTPQHSSSPLRDHCFLPEISPTSLSPGFYNPAPVPTHYTDPLTRAKFHLRHRTAHPVTFSFLDAHEENLVKDDPQYIDAEHLTSISPFYARTAKQNPRYSVIPVPSNFSVRTVNIFVQLVAPWPATKLPEHYLWKAQKPVPGVYDRFGAIEAKVIWTVDTLFDLLFFAQMLEVYLIIDMVVNRLHFTYVEQNRYKDICKAIRESEKGWVNIGGRSVFVGARLPVAENRLAGVSADDFEKEVLERLVAGSVHLPTLTFVGDLASALGGDVDIEWLGSAVPEVRDVFINANVAPLHINTREEFCTRYHHHNAALQPCYTSHTSYPITDIINALYATTTPQEPINLSKGLLPPSSLSNILYADTGEADKLNKDNSSFDMLEGEKMAMEMESRLEEAKAALRRVREAPEAEKRAALEGASKAAGAVYGPSQL